MLDRFGLDLPYTHTSRVISCHYKDKLSEDIPSERERDLRVFMVYVPISRLEFMGWISWLTFHNTILAPLEEVP